MMRKRKQLSCNQPFPLAWRRAPCILPGVRPSPGRAPDRSLSVSPARMVRAGLVLSSGGLTDHTPGETGQVSPAAAMARCRAASHIRMASATAAENEPRRGPAARAKASRSSLGTVAPDSRTEWRAASGVECQRVPRWRSVTAPPPGASARRGAAAARPAPRRGRGTRAATPRRRALPPTLAPRPTAGRWSR